jgi:hypothetical protein
MFSTMKNNLLKCLKCQNIVVANEKRGKRRLLTSRPNILVCFCLYVLVVFQLFSSFSSVEDIQV